MNGAKILFIILCGAVFKVMAVGGSPIFTPTFETFTVPALNFDPLDCDIIDLTCSNIAAAIANVGLFLFFIGVIITNIIVYLGQLIIFIPIIIFEPLPDAPWYVNLMIIGTPTIMLILYMISQFKPGSDA